RQQLVVGRGPDVMHSRQPGAVDPQARPSTGRLFGIARAMVRSMEESQRAAYDPRRRGKTWVRVGHGVKIATGLTGRDAGLGGLRAWRAVRPASAAWTGLTGAEVHGLWLPPLTDGPLFVATGTVKGEVYPVRSELAIARHPTQPAVVDLEGVRVEPV